MAQETLQKFFEKLEGKNKENNFKQTEIGLIPEDWKVVRLGKIMEPVSKKTRQIKVENGKFYKQITVRLYARGLTIRAYLPGEKIKTKKQFIVKEGDFVFSKIDARNGAYGFVPLELDGGIVSNDFPILRIKNGANIFVNFLSYYLSLPQNWERIRSFACGTTNRKRIGIEDFLNAILIPLPPLSEQRKIARVLDKIQQAIELQDRIIEQAKRLKKSLMQKLFTEGLYGEEQKETEIGLIPKSWEVVKLGEIGIFEYGYTETALEENTGIKFLRITDIKDDGLILWNEVPYCKISETKLKKYQLENGDILFARIGATTGKTCFIESPPKSVFASYLIRLKIETDVYKKFVYYYTQTPIYWSQVEANKEGKLKKGISATLLRTFKIPLPSLEEQKQIAHILSTVDKKIEVEQKRKQVLKELFKTMLHKLMSGEIRLKEVEI